MRLLAVCLALALGAGCQGLRDSVDMPSVSDSSRFIFQSQRSFFAKPDEKVPAPVPPERQP